MLFFARRMLNRETPVSRFSRHSPTVFRGLKSFREASPFPSVSQRMPFFREHPLKILFSKGPRGFLSRERERERDPVTDRLFFPFFFFLYLIRLLSLD